MKKSIFLLVFLFLAVFDLLHAADDDDIVWKYQIQIFDEGLLLKNESVIFLKGAHSVFRDAVTGEEIARYQNYDKYNNNFTNSFIFLFNEDRNYAQASIDNKKIYIFETDNYSIIDSIENNNVKFGQLSGRQRTGIIYEAADSTTIRVWDIVQKKVVREISIPINERAGTKPETIAVHSNLSVQGVDCDNKRLLVAQETEYELDNFPPMSEYVNTLAFYDVETSEKLYSFNDIKGTFRISNTCKYIAKIKGDINGTLELYDFKTMELIRSFDGSSIFGIVFSSDDKYMMAYDNLRKYKMELWDIEHNKLLKTYGKGSSKVLAVTSDNQFAYCNAAGEFYKLRLNIDSGSIGVEDDPSEDSIPYPNPTRSKINFEFRLSIPDVYSLKVVDFNGKEVLTKPIGHLNSGLNKVELEKSNLADGRYFVIIYSPSNTVRYSIIIGE